MFVEHTVGGGNYIADAHLIHRSVRDSEEFLVIGVFLTVTTSKIYSTNNSLLQTLWNTGGDTIDSIAQYKSVTDSAILLNPYTSLFPGDRKFYTYTGSLTTPPCSGNTLWVHYDSPVPISQDDADILRAAALKNDHSRLSVQGNNARPIQPISDRVIYYSDGIPVVPSTPNELSSNEYGIFVFAGASTILFWGMLVIWGIEWFRKKLKADRLEKENKEKTTELSIISPFSA